MAPSDVSLLLCTVALTLLSASSGHAQQEVAEEFSIVVDVPLVVLYPTVTDRSGSVARGLRQEDFQVFVDGKLQPISVFSDQDIPVSVGLIIDNSGSIAGKRQLIAAGGMAFAAERNQDDELFVVHFSDTVRMGLPASQPFTSNHSELQAALERMTAAGKTALYDAIDRGLRQLESAKFEKKALLVIGDGGDNASAASLDDVVERAERAGVILYTVGVFDPNADDKNPGVLRRLAKATGGESYFPESADEVASICERIAADIRSQYTLGIRPPTTEGEEYHKINVKARRPDGSKLNVRTREGYYGQSKPDDARSK